MKRPQRNLCMVVAATLGTVGAAVAGCIEGTAPPSLPGAPAQVQQAGTVGTATPAHPCAAHLGVKPWEGNYCTGNLSRVVSAGPVELMYNSLDANTLGPAGYGVRIGARDRLTVNGDGSVSHILPSGEAIKYSPAGGGTFASPPETTTTLTNPSSGSYVLNVPGGTKLNFTRPNNLNWVLSSVIDRVGNSSTVSYDTADNETAITDAMGASTTLVWSSGLLSTVTDAEGLVWSLTYDGSRQLTSVRGPAVNGAAPTESLVYDTGGRHLLVQDTTPDGVVSGNYDYNADGTLAAFSDSSGHKSVVSSFARQVRVTDAFNSTLTYNYSGNQELTQIVDATGVSMFQNSYDALHRLIQTTDSLGKSESYTYNGTNDIINQTDRYGKVSTFSYSNHNLISQTDDSNKTTTVTYDANDLPLVITDPVGRKTTHNRAANGNLLNVVGPDNTTYGALTYGAHGEVLSATDQYGYQTTVAYDANLNPTTITRPNGLVDRVAFSKLGRPLSSTTPANETSSFNYDAANRLVGGTTPTNGTWSQTLDVAGRPTALSNNSGPTAISWSQSFASDGRVQSTAVNSISDQTGASSMNIPPPPAPPTCTPNCAGRTCGSDGCTGMCGTCTSGQSCSMSGTCVSGSCGASGTGCTAASQCCSQICNFGMDAGSGGRCG